MKLSASLNDPAIFGIRKLSPHFTARRSASAEFPDGFLSEIKDYSISLNGIWAFHWSPDLEHLPEGFEQPGYSVNNWKKIELPATFEMNGYGTPIYLNYGYPFRVKPPFVSEIPPENYTSFRERNPTGSCRRSFTLPNEWSGQLIHLCCYGVQSAFRFWINGKFAGYSEDSAGIAEFDISEFCHSGENLIAMQVYKYCSGSYLEDQDCWRFSGIFRDIEIHALDPFHIADAVISADPETGMIRAQTVLSDDRDCTLELRSGKHTSGEQRSHDLSCRLPEYRLWSHEKPELYPATLILRHAGKICDIRHFRIGFRSIRIADRQIWLNGVPIKLRGVNRHEIHPRFGRVVRRADMEQDIRMIKAANFNAVRNSHYPMSPVWYELCDLHGLYVMDEANVESHGLSYHKCVLPGDDPVWEPVVLDRVCRMVRQNRNHPCVLIWSMGNEAGYGNAFTSARDAIRKLDSRPVHYADMNSAADFDSRTYPPCSWLLKYANGNPTWAGEHGEVTSARQFTPQPSQKPFIANEYAHAMGNSTGNLADLWRIFEEYPMFAGGFVWEWCEHALDQDGVSAQAYGGDFGDFPNNGNFCCDGLVSANRIPNPGYEQMRAVQKPFEFELTGQGDFLITNKFYFTDLSECVLFWSLVVDGHIEKEGELRISLPPGKTVSVPKPCSLPSAQNISWRLKLLKEKCCFGEAEAIVCRPEPCIPAAEEIPCQQISIPHLQSQIEIALDRVWTDNDIGCRFHELCADSIKHGISKLNFFRRNENCYRAELSFEGGETARIGIRFLLSGISAVEWFGLGPMQSYCDSKELALNGLWKMKPDELFFHYTKPQENGHRSEVQYLLLTFADNSKWKITASRRFGFNLYHITHEELKHCAHDHEIRPGKEWELTLDLWHRGLGGDNSWGAQPMDPYRLLEKQYMGSFLLEYIPEI